MTSPQSVEEALPGLARDGKFSDQQKMIFDRIVRGVQGVNSANESLLSRAATLVAASTGLFSVTSIIAVFVGTGDGIGNLAVWPAAGAGLLFLALTFAAGSVWQPADSLVAGSSDVVLTYETYVATDADESFCRAFADNAAVLESEVERNAIISRRLAGMVYLLDAQAFFLLLTVLLAFAA